jgi:hypothetical protein
MAYSDWQRAGGYSRALTQHAIRMVQRNLTPGGDKNGADINLALDALEMAFTHPHINAFVIVGGDSDFISLVEKLKQYDKKVFVVGGRQFTSAIMQRNCHEFIAYENLVSQGGGGRRASGGRGEAKGDAVKLDQVVPLVRRALAVLSERDVTPQLGLLKSTLLQLDSTFSEKSYGAGSFREFAQKLERAGVLTVSQGKGGWMVGPVVGGAVAGDAAGPATTDDPGEAATPPESRAREPRGQDGRGPRPPMPETIGNAADGVRELAVILAGAEVRRWPLYLRNLKQIIKQVRPTFDERAYGFANLTDLARAAHREGVLRIERDRQGNIRMFQGTASLSGVPTAAAGDADEVGASEGVGADAAEAGVDDSGVVEDAGNTVSDRDDDQGVDVAGDERDERAAKAPAKAPARGRAARGKAAHDDQDSEHEAGDVNGNVASPRKGAASRASKSRRPATARKATATPRRPRAKKKS